MSNIDIVRVMLVAMQSLAYMVVWYVRGNDDKAEVCKDNFDKILSNLDKMSELEKGLNSHGRE